MHRIWLYQKREPFVSHFIFECRLTFPAFRLPLVLVFTASTRVGMGDEGRARSFEYVGRGRDELRADTASERK